MFARVAAPSRAAAAATSRALHIAASRCATPVAATSQSANGAAPSPRAPSSFIGYGYTIPPPADRCDKSIKVELSRPFKGHRLEPPPPVAYTSKEELMQLYRVMTYYRRFEIVADTMYKQRLIRGFCHLYDGQEAIVTGMESALKVSCITRQPAACNQEPASNKAGRAAAEPLCKASEGACSVDAGRLHCRALTLLFLCVTVLSLSQRTDSVITAYRDHCHQLSRGDSGESVMAELMGKEPGCSRGKGGSMHMYLEAGRFYGGNGIVGAQIPLGAGLAFAHKYRKDGGVVVAAMGDGASNQGQVSNTCTLFTSSPLPLAFSVLS